MNLLKRLFGKKKPVLKTNDIPVQLVKLYDLDKVMKPLLSGSHYIAKSEYLGVIDESKEIIKWFEVLKSSGTLDDFCKKNNAPISEVTSIINRFNNLIPHHSIYSLSQATTKLSLVEREKNFISLILLLKIKLRVF